MRKALRRRLAVATFLEEKNFVIVHVINDHYPRVQKLSLQPVLNEHDDVALIILTASEAARRCHALERLLEACHCRCTHPENGIGGVGLATAETVLKRYL